MRLAASPSRSDRMIGTPPATAASKPSSTPRRRAASNSSRPWVGTKALLAVTTWLPAAMARRMNVRAGSRPPISSMTTDTAGSAKTRSTSVVSGQSARVSPARGLVMSRSATAAIRSRQPAFASSPARFVWWILSTPPPTVPMPSSPIPISLMTGPRRRAASAQGLLDTAHRLPDAVLVLDQGEPHESLAALAEADARGGGARGLGEGGLGHPEGCGGAVGCGDWPPPEHGPPRFPPLPADPGEPVPQHVAPPPVGLDRLGHAGLGPLQRHDAGDLDQL